MKAILKWGALALALVLVFGWIFREEVVLTAIEIAFARRTPVGSHREIIWQSGDDPIGRARETRPPNIVLILADDLGSNDLSYAGGGVALGTVPTPNIDSIAREGVTFTQGYAAHSSCAPSRAAILSGRYGTRFGFEFTPTPPGMVRLVGSMTDNTQGRLRKTYRPPGEPEVLSFDQMGMPASEMTLAEVLKQADYHTVHIGKWHLGGTNGMAPEEQGFDESLLMRSGLYLPKDDPNVVNSEQEFDPIDRFLWRAVQWAASFNGGDTFAPGGYLTDYYTDEAVRVIEANRNRPFFLYLAHWAPHTPLQATRADYDALSHIADHRLRVYAAMIRALDRGVGRVLKALEENGLEGNTLVLFTSDNGGAGYIGLPEVNHPYRGFKLTFFEGGIHVPFFAKWPGRLPAGATFGEPVHGFDLFATAAAAAGAALPADREIDGVDLVPFATGEKSGAPHEELFWRAGHYQVALIDGWKLQVSERPETAWLFDLEADPTEQHNLAAREPARVAAMREALARHNAKQARPAWAAMGELPVNIDKDLSQDDAPDDEYVYVPN